MATNPLERSVKKQLRLAIEQCGGPAPEAGADWVELGDQVLALLKRLQAGKQKLV